MGNVAIIDLVIIFGSLAIPLYIGIRASRHIGTVSLYAVGEKNFSTLTVFCTVFSTLVGGKSIIGRAEKVFSVGLVYILASLGYFLSHFFIGYFIAPKMKQFKDCISLGEIFEQQYGLASRVVSGFLGFLYGSGKLAIEIAAIGFIFEVFVGISYFWGVIFGFGIVILYSSFGGVKSVTLTDVFQCMLILVAVPLIAFCALKTTGSWSTLWKEIYHDYPSHINPFLSPDLLKKYLPLLVVFAIPSLHPATVQRLLLLKNPQQGKIAFIGTSFLELFIYVLVAVAALVVLKMNPSINANHTFPYLINELFPVGIKGFAIAGLVATAMSSADSVLNSGCVTFIHDCIKPIARQRLTDLQELRLMRFFTFIMGLVAIPITLRFQNLVDMVIGMKTYWMPLIIPPLIGTLLGFRTTKFRFWAAFMAGLISVIVWENTITVWYKWDSLLPATLVNVSLFFGAKPFLHLLGLGRKEKKLN